MFLIDTWSYHSKYRKISPPLKCLFAVVILLVTLIISSPVVSAAVFLIMGLLNISGSISIKNYIRLLRVPFAFLVLSAGTVILEIHSYPLSLFAVSIGSRYLTASYEGFIYGSHLFITAFACVSCLYFLSLSTPIPDILMVLRKIHCPHIMIELMLLIYRFIFILTEVSSSLSTAAKARLGNRSFSASCRSAGNLMSVLLIRAFQHSSELYNAMEARCYDGIIYTLEEDAKIKERN